MIIIEIPGYSSAGGPPFFPDRAHMKDFVCIKAFDKSIGKRGGNIKTRKQFPLELAYVMTAFKGIGATHARTIAKLKGMFHKPGLFLVACTRVKNPKHLHIPNDQFPTVDDLRQQRLNLDVLASQN